jgi:hypothetical protein
LTRLLIFLVFFLKAIGFNNGLKGNKTACLDVLHFGLDFPAISRVHE